MEGEGEGVREGGEVIVFTSIRDPLRNHCVHISSRNREGGKGSGHLTEIGML